MPEIVETKNRKGETRFGWRCECKKAAGAWPKRSTAEESARRHAEATNPQRVDGKWQNVLTCEATRKAAA